MKTRKRKAQPLTIEQQKANFVEQLMNRYWSEKELENLLPELIKQSTSYELITAITAHLATTQRQIIRLIHVFDSLEERAVGLRCTKMTAMINDAAQIQENFASGYPKDNAIISQCQTIMTHEIASYKALKQQASILNEEVAESYLSVAIQEEKNAHAVLTEIALHSIYFDEAV